MDNAELFIKYIALIIKMEGIDYVERAEPPWNENLQFSEDEIMQLSRLAEQAREKYKVEAATAS